MQDFTKPVAINNNPVTQANTSSEKWLNKDRIWNFVFWLGMSGGLAVSNWVNFNLKLPQIATAIDLMTLVVIPSLLLMFNRTNFIKKDTFANSDGKMITKKQMPYSFVLATMVGMGFTFIVVETIFPKQLGNLFIEFIFFLCLFSGFSLYCILKNCPISILFNYKFWTFEPYKGGRRPSINNDYYDNIENNIVFRDSSTTSVWGRSRKY